MEMINDSNVEISNREVEYLVECPMTGVELVLNYTDDSGFVTQDIISSFPWKMTVEVSPLKNIRMLGYLRYVDENVMLKYLDLKAKIDVGNKYLNTEWYKYQGNTDEYITNDDLKRNSYFSLDIAAIEDRVEYECLPQW